MQPARRIESFDKENNLRDHMDDIELILTMLGEATTTEITKEKDSKGFEKLKSDAKSGGEVAGNTRRPHWTLGPVSPLRYIVSTLPERECHMLWTSTKI